MKTDELIEMLSRDTAVRGPLSARLAWAFLLGGVAASLAFAAFVGIRPDILLAGQSGRFLFKLVFACALLSIAAGAVTQVGRPDARLGPWWIALLCLVGALGLAVVAELVVTPSGLWAKQLIGRNAVFCLVVIPSLSLAPLACLLYALREGAPARPGLAGAIAGLAASGIAVTLYATHCPDDSPLFVATWYTIATALVTGAGYVAGRRILRW